MRPWLGACAIATLTLVRAPALALAQQAGSPGTPPASPAAGASGDSGAIAALVVLGVLVIAVAALVGLLDLRRKREAEAVHLQAQVSDGLLRDRDLFGLPVTATARVPWRGSPVTVEVAGQVPSEEARQAVLRVARREAERLRRDVLVEDRLLIVPAMARAA